MRRIIFEQSLKKLAASRLQTRNEGGIGTLPFGEGGLVVGERGDTGPRLFVGGTKDARQELDHKISVNRQDEPTGRF
jgi:hypothetical protein